MDTGSVRVCGTLDTGDKTWARIYENTLSVTATSVTISGLTGDTDIEYRLVVNIIPAENGNASLKINNDAGANYGAQELYAVDTTVGASRSVYNYIYLLQTAMTSGKPMQGEIFISAKSGYIRTANGVNTGPVNGTTITLVAMGGWSWNNTADEITSLVVSSTTASGLGIGTSIELWSLR